MKDRKIVEAISGARRFNVKRTNDARFPSTDVAGNLSRMFTRIEDHDNP